MGKIACSKCNEGNHVVFLRSLEEENEKLFCCFICKENFVIKIGVTNKVLEILYPPREGLNFTN